MKYPEYEKAFSPARLNKYLTALLGIIDVYLFSIISSNSAGVTTIGVFGKCFVLPVTRNDPSLDKAIS